MSTADQNTAATSSPNLIEWDSSAAAAPNGGGTAVTLADLHAANIARQAEWCPDQVPDLSFRGNELGGECGEAQNVIKKLERERLGWRGSRATVEQLAEELADVIICADLCAVTAGIDLAAAVVAKFNATSEKVGLTTKLAAGGEVDLAKALRDAYGQGCTHAVGFAPESATAYREKRDAWIRQYMARLAPADALDIAGAV